MTWQSLGVITPIEGEWSDYQPTTQAPASPVDGIFYRLTGLNVDPFDPDKFFALVRFKYGAEDYSRGFRLMPSGQPQIAMVEIPPAITTFPFTWVPQVQLLYQRQQQRPAPIRWAIRIDEFVEPDMNATALANLSRFLY